VTGSLRHLFQAEFAGVGQVDLRGTASRRWADSPGPIPASPEDFHTYAASHPLARAYQHTREPVPLRLSDVTSAQTAPPAFGGMSRALTIPLAITPHHVCAIALMRDRLDFSARDLRLACQLQPVLSGIYALRDRLAHQPPALTSAKTDVPLTARELAILNLMADGLIAAAIARRLGISRGTVSKHIDHLYRKLGTHDRTSAVLRGQALGAVAARQAEL